MDKRIFFVPVQLRFVSKAKVQLNKICYALTFRTLLQTEAVRHLFSLHCFCFLGIKIL